MGITPFPVFKPAQCVITQLHYVTFEALRPQNVFTYTHDCLQNFMRAATGCLTTQLRMYEQQLTAAEFAYKVNLWRKALADMIDQVHEYGRCMRKHQGCSVVYKQWVQSLIRVMEDVEHCWCDECKADCRLTNVQLNEQKPVIKKRWSVVKQQLYRANISQQLILIVSEPIMNLLLKGKGVKKSAVAYWLKLMDAIEVMVSSGKADTAALAWLLIRYNFNERAFLEYCIALVEEDLCSRETLNDKLCLLEWLRRQGTHLNLFAHTALLPDTVAVKDLLSTWLQLKIEEYDSQVAMLDTNRWHILSSAGVVTLIGYAMHQTGFTEGTVKQLFARISGTCRLVKSKAPKVDYLEKELYARKPEAKREALDWLRKWIRYIETW